MYPINDFIFFIPQWVQAQQGEQLPQFIEQLVDMARDNPLIAIGALVAVLFLTSLLPRRRHGASPTRTYGGRPLSYHLGRALGNLFRGSRRR